MKSALIVDDHPVVRAAVKIVLMQEGFKRIYEAACGNEVLPKIRELKPDLVILDLVMPSLDGLDVLTRIKASGVPSRVLVFTSQEPIFFQDRCMHAGAVAYVAKTNDLQHLHKAVHAVMAGYTYFAQLPLASVALNSIQLSEKQMIDTLSDRELTILQYLCRGFSNKAIAECTHLSHKTVSTYKTRLVGKLNVESAVHLRDFAKRNHLI
ncbi:two-component system, NarL family, response regulator EvgA [Pseudomonas frederiksbergensis]|jgi:Response regulator containing a CheY-like receiver domain and an HTH DNA-binding domain|uniref:Two-component system, NarL family, response regulator EvgA n=1 Tax=Pseudomonas frederiksbergensis TaxID=104087 RepID=A0A1H5GU96_9PSED|nr:MULTISPECIES: response regulator transcription factor [Pseudomonas]PMU07648.1 DNA-binding response regulator [Pseudomonas sp. FW305-20]PMU13905.1 DNA-binding response regulator [Pseudomonas sp. FW305-122]PMU35834.1 DNA-binding response regulator [Pseudomonas sp. FW305-47B]PMX57815.1 DNA-binding response regulator [Pseudomonas sp. FW305-33]PMX65021.1 DNA-binding response regulator [Pseudomonas sp. FW305-60]